ncbi:MAG: FHA domain-containing protein [Acidobacteria bacterium]|nr:FHA domain-containing protein [Acidobacteriota bacterium]
MPKVIIWRDGAIETEFDPGHRDWRMGRSETNDITLLDPNKSVSRFHAELREENGRWLFIDLNSQNGSWKDGQRVNRLVLEHGHEVLFGDYRLVFHEDHPVAPPPPPPPVHVADHAPAHTPVPPPVPLPPDVTADVSSDVSVTAEVPASPDLTLLMPGKVEVPASGPPPAPAPVVRSAVKPKPARKGVNPIILVLFLLAMIGAVAAAAWKLVLDRPVEPRVVADVEPEPPPVVTPPPVDPPPAVEPPVEAPLVEEPPLPPVEEPPAGKAQTSGTRARRQQTTEPKDNPAVVSRYEDGRRALNAGRFVEAERAFQAVLAQQPGFRDASSLLAQARDGQAAARQKALDEARALEGKGEWTRAVAAYQRAGAADEAAAARTKMAEAGDDAYRKARQFDARNRPVEAIGWYQRAVDWLPDSDARKATAQERLTALKGGGE